MECSGILMLFVSSVLLAITQAASVAEARQQLEPSLEKLKGYLKNAQESAASSNHDSYFTDDVLPPVYISRTIDEGDEDNDEGYAKRGSIFRFGKRGYIFRYGRGDDDGFADGLEHYYPDKRTIFRYGKRRIHAPFRFGKDLDESGSRRK